MAAQILPVSPPLGPVAISQRSLLSDAWRRLNRSFGAKLGLALVLGFVLLAIFAGVISHYGSNDQ
ncbi:MAG: hypothetical protein KGJ86_22635, partial [Chloroflexota bacterium]|nr:hypothetical protein [Chloroflexota bacterium]